MERPSGFQAAFRGFWRRCTGGESFLKKALSPGPPLPKTFDLMESLFAACLFLIVSGLPPDFLWDRLGYRNG